MNEALVLHLKADLEARARAAGFDPNTIDFSVVRIYADFLIAQAAALRMICDEHLPRVLN